MTFHQISRGGAVAARVAHNHEVAGSSPAPATKINDSSKDGSFFLVLGIRFESATLEVAGINVQWAFMFSFGSEARYRTRSKDISMQVLPPLPG